MHLPFSTGVFPHMLSMCSKPPYWRRYSLTIAAACALLPAVALAELPQTSPANNRERFEQIWRTTRDNFYDPRMKGLDWSQVGDRYREKAAQATTQAEFQAVINRMLDELHASHSGYFTPDDMEYYLLQSLFQNDMDRLRMEHIGVMGVREGEAFVVRALFDDGPAKEAGLKAGDRILSVEGQPFTTVGVFRGRESKPVKMTIERNGAQQTITVFPVRENPQRAFLDSTRRSARIIQQGGKKIGYIHLWTMTNDSFRETLENALLNKLADTDGLILDLRDGFGGHAFRFTDVLFRPDVVWKQTQRGRLTVFHMGYEKPLVVLINEGTRSAKESFAFQIARTKRGTLVGKTTAGAFLGAGGFTIGSDGYLELPIVDLTLDGKRLEAIGVSPNIVVDSEDAYGPNDRQLKRGIEVLLDKLKGSAGS